jgi:tetratricopeptide (TPR) repeat protein
MQTDASEERLSKYELIRLLGAGGMGEVYLARDTVLQRQVAIKFVSAARTADPDANARLLREARAAATLDHPGICPVYDVDVDRQGRTCIVMQYIEGETLAERLSRGALDPAEALGLAAAVADALAAAHARGLVHRDLKPQNVMVTPDGRPKLLDFGIAHAEISPDAVAEIVTHTATVAWSPGAMVGTPAYMSPEQVLRKPIDGRSDLFSLGAVLFECLAGRPAFQAATDLDTWARVAYVVPPAPSSLNPRVPAAADSIVTRLLAKEAGERFASAADAARALREASGPRPPTGAAGQGTRRRALIAAVVVAAAALVGFVGWRTWRLDALPPPPAPAKVWYDRGTEHLRNGAYYSAKLALQEAIKLHPSYALAMARLAEAQSQLDEERDAQATLVRVSTIVPDTSRLSREEEQRLEAIRALVFRDISRASDEYRKLANANPKDLGVWLDLASVEQRAGLRDEARRAGAAALALPLGAQSAAAHLRMGAIAAEEVRRDEALKEFGEAQRLYSLARDAEGEAEALLQRARFLDAIGEFSSSTAALDAATTILASNRNPFQEVHALMLRSSLIASSGDAEKARRTAEEAVETARTNNLDTVAADALIEAGTALMRLTDYNGARERLQTAYDLATRSGANRVVARATLQLASLYLTMGQPADARNLAQGVLDFIRRGQYRRLELIALSIIAGSHEQDDIMQAQQLSRQVLSVAESLHDNREVATALQGLARISAILGAYPEALALRLRLEQLHRDQHDTENLAFDLTNRADLLIRLGRFDEAEAPLRELETGAANGIRVYANRARRIAFLRALAAVERHDFAAAAASADELLKPGALPKTPDTIQVTAEAFRTLARPSLRQKPDARPWTQVKESDVTPELRYWRAVALLARGDAPAAEAQADAALATLNRSPSAEFEWRMAAIASAAARRRGDTAKADEMAARAQAALKSVRNTWKADTDAYERRADLTERRRAAGLS